jgi:hypothetical protein
MRHAALQRPVALLAAVGIAVMAIAAFFHHHGPLVLDATPDRPSIVGVSDEGPSACALCSGDPATCESPVAVAPGPELSRTPLRPFEVPSDHRVALASGTPRSPPPSAAFAV